MKEITKIQIICGVSFMVFFVNLLEIILLVKTKIRWCNAYILVLSLAIADATFGLTTAISLIFAIRFGLTAIHYKSGETLAVIFVALFYGNMFGSLFIAILISIDRWIAVKWPLRYRTLITKTRIYVAAFSAWIAGVVIVCGGSLFRKFTKNYGYTYLLQIIIVISILTPAYLYCSIFFLYRKSNRIRKNDHSLKSNFKRRSMQQGQEQTCVERESGVTLLSTINSDLIGPQNTRDNEPQRFLELNKRLIQISDKEKRLLKFCLTLVACICLSYLPLNLLLWPRISKKIPLLINLAVNLNALCGSLWNPFLYFLHQFLERKKNFGTK